ncbi:MAG TPA: bifunctional 5,10-methylenetetrahydrofolate dehydrogenase/5,10-methenyltetrahydrofolate cyclohydrolase [Planctomycetota bacterium]|nr:bifunctional 5,10-methylenetetrahydrofolate dehydrogenase/5,10-methenyltetrahydrofolate cyclohydrolase [Planctomycetota bacterium]
MTARIIDGKAIANDIRTEVAEGVARLKKRGITPGLATVLVGDNPASHKYVAMKRKACAEAGIESFHHELPRTAAPEEVLALVRKLGADRRVHGILVQLPLPFDDRPVLEAVPLSKDVDGFHPLNVGGLAMKGREPDFVPCTPAGVIELLDRSGTRIAGADAVVLGRSNIVGMPVALLLVGRDATVTVCHSKTRSIEEVCRRADILVAAIGRARFVKGSWIKPGATVIDVGTNVIDDPGSKTGKRLVGDVDYEAALEVAGAITPVPGGVGPMTIAMLLRNTLKSAERS